MKDRLVHFFLAIFLLAGSTDVCAQEPPPSASYGISFHYGSLLTLVPKAEYLRDGPAYLGEAWWARRAKREGAVPWGIMLFRGQTGSRKQIGSVSGAALFTALPLSVSSRWKAGLRLAAGLGWVSRPYDPVINHKNVLIGSHLNGYVQFGLQGEWAFSPLGAVVGGLSFTHLSNGSITLPNLGINIPAVSLGVRTGPSSFEKSGSGEKQASAGWYFSASAGLRQVPWINSPRYLLTVLNGEWVRPVGGRGEWGIGLSLVHNPSLAVDPERITPEKRDISKIQAGVYTGYALKAGRVSLPVQLGAYLYNRDSNPVLFQQLGIRARFSKKVWGQVMLKVHGGKADLIHAGIGYKIGKS